MRASRSTGVGFADLHNGNTPGAGAKWRAAVVRPGRAALLALVLAGCAPRASRPAVGVELVRREGWEARRPVAPMKRHRIAGITIHHTATRQQPGRPLEEKMRALQRFSQAPGALAGGGAKPAWPDVPYHFYLDATGRVAEGRSPRFAGDTNTDYDPRGELLIVLEGNFEEEEPTEAQLESLRKLLAASAARHGVPAGRIVGHRDHARTLCPGARLQRLLPALREQAARDLAERRRS